MHVSSPAWGIPSVVKGTTALTRYLLLRQTLDSPCSICPERFEEVPPAWKAPYMPRTIAQRHTREHSCTKRMLPPHMSEKIMSLGISTVRDCFSLWLSRQPTWLRRCCKKLRVHHQHSDEMVESCPIVRMSRSDACWAQRRGLSLPFRLISERTASNRGEMRRYAMPWPLVGADLSARRARSIGLTRRYLEQCLVRGTRPTSSSTSTTSRHWWHVLIQCR